MPCRATELLGGVFIHSRLTASGLFFYTLEHTRQEEGRWDSSPDEDSEMRILTVICLCLCLQVVSASYGNEYLLAFPQNSDADGDIWLTITPAHGKTTPIEVTLWDSDGLNVENITLTSGQSQNLIRPKDLKMPMGCSIQSKHTIHIQASDDILVAVRNIGHSNNELYLALPVNELRNEYFVFSYQPSISTSIMSSAFIVIVSTENANMVSIALPQAEEVSESFIFYEGMYYTNGDVVTVTLEQYEAFQLQSLFDLTGSHVTSTFPIGVWSGLNRTKIIDTCHSHVSEMIPPIQTYGFSYVLVPIQDSTTEEEFRLLARESDTWISVHVPDQNDPVKYYLPHAGNFVQIESKGEKVYMLAEATKPVAVAGYVTGGKGDAMMKILTPIGAAHVSDYRWIGYGDFHLTFVVARDEEPAMLFNGIQLTPQTGQEWSYEAYEVIGRSDLIVGHLLVPDINDGSQYSLSHPGGVEFMAYVDMIAYCEGEGMPLAYSMDSVPMPPVPETDIDVCCYRLSDEDEVQSHLGQECSNSNNMTQDGCCVKNETIVNCKASHISHKCETWPYQRTAVKSQTTNQHTLLACYGTCIITAGCIGVNYAKTGDVEQNCELLFGYFEGFLPNSTLRYVQCSSKTTFVIV